MKKKYCGPASFPNWVRAILSALLSDECCKYHDQLYDEIVSKKEADEIFIECLEAKKIANWKIKIVKFFINKYGDKYYGKY